MLIGYIIESYYLLYKENFKKSNKKNGFKFSRPTFDEKFDLTDGLFLTSDIQDYFQCSINKAQNTDF